MNEPVNLAKENGKGQIPSKMQIKQSKKGRHSLAFYNVKISNEDDAKENSFNGIIVPGQISLKFD